MRLLLIEDNREDAISIQRSIDQWGHGVTVDWVGTLAEGLKVLDQYQAVIVDLGLPDADFANDLDDLSQLREIPCVVFTGNVDPRLSYEIGKQLTGVVIKGISPDALLCQLANQIGQFETRSEREIDRRKLVLQLRTKLAELAEATGEQR